jgi:DNA-directed RNA polymerase specialized sigma24 family protein
MALSTRVLRPVSFNVQNPLYTVFEESDALMKSYDYPKWALIKRNIVAQLLHIESHGAFLNGAVRTAPNIEISDTIDELKNLITNSYYFSTQYWRAFYYWINKGGKFNPRWPQFGEAEAQITMSLLTPGQLELVTVKAKGIWPEAEMRKRKLEQIFHQIQARISSLCYTRLRYLMQYDPALYSAEDLKQIVNYELLKRFQASDFFDDDPTELIGWAIRCADNIIHNLREYAQAGKRAKLIVVQEGDRAHGVETQFLFREVAIHTPLKEESRSNFTLAESIRLLGDGPWDQVVEMRDRICLEQLLAKADSKIKTYLKIIWGGEHNPDFWSWFYRNEPKLASRAEYIQENPEAISHWVEVWLKLPRWRLMAFFKENMPELIDDWKGLHGQNKARMGTGTEKSGYYPTKAAG